MLDILGYSNLDINVKIPVSQTYDVTVKDKIRFPHKVKFEDLNTII